MMKKILQYLLAVTFSWLYALELAAAQIINVTNQAEFDSLSQSIASLIENTERTTINVMFQNGIYNFRDDHICLSNVNCPDVTLSFEGNGCIIMAEGDDYVSGDSFTDDITPDEAFITYDGKDYNSWSRMLRTSNYLIEVVDKDNMLCRLNVSDLSYLKNKSEEECRWMYIWIPQSYYSRTYKVKKIESGYIYFTTSSINDINRDHSYGKITELRFRLSNNPDERGDILITDNHIYLPKGIDKIRRAKSDRFIKLFDTKLKEVSFKGFNIIGNSYKDLENTASQDLKHLIDVKKLKCERFCLESCEFRSIHTTRVVNLISTNNVDIKNCRFEDIYQYGVFQDRTSRYFLIHGCIFHNVNKQINNTFAVWCRGSDFHVYDNVISDFGYSAIAAGIWHRHKDITLNCNGVIEHNEIYYTYPYFEKADEHNLMDSGAIYLYTLTNGTVVCYNHIHHYSGAHSNRGIFCDDGAKNFIIFGNTILNIANSYSIDSRRVSDKDDQFGGLNVNNIIRDNIVDRPIRFQGNEKVHNGCIFEDNIHVDGNYKDDVISNVNQ